MITAPAFDAGARVQEMRLAREEVRQIPPVTSRLPDFDLAAAHAVSRRIHETRGPQGAQPIGRKIGFTNPPRRAQYDVSAPV
ncbi:MAG: hypothetical protein U1F52_08255 [Burkholderiales bacterium]